MKTEEFNIVMAASEAVPFAKTGGLADVVGALSQTLAQRGNKVFLFLPFYRCIKRQNLDLEVKKESLRVRMGSEEESFRLLATFRSGIPVYFIEKDKYYDREALYGTLEGDFPDNLERFTFFCKAILKSILEINLAPHIIHCHDWQTALIPLYLKTLYFECPLAKKSKTIFTIHNLAYQGIFPGEEFPLLDLGWEYFTPQSLEFYGRLNLMKGGLIFADLLNTVSEKYCQEIQNPEFGCGLEGVLKERVKDLWGILNGIDYKEWEPRNDEYIPYPYSFKDIERKALNKEKLQENQTLPVNKNTPLIGVVSRLSSQKGLDLLEEAFKELTDLDFQLVILGTGEKEHHQLLKNMEQKYPQKVSLNLKFDLPLSHLIYAGSDFFLMPSRYEPCGLSQLISFRYGTVPIVRTTGGLADTVKGFNPLRSEGNGFTFSHCTSSSLIKAIQRALDVYQNKKIWQNLITSVMKLDFSWSRSAEKYEKMYEKAISDRTPHLSPLP